MIEFVSDDVETIKQMLIETGVEEIKKKMLKMKNILKITAILGISVIL